MKSLYCSRCGEPFSLDRNGVAVECWTCRERDELESAMDEYRRLIGAAFDEYGDAA